MDVLLFLLVWVIIFHWGIIDHFLHALITWEFTGSWDVCYSQHLSGRLAPLLQYTGSSRNTPTICVNEVNGSCCLISRGSPLKAIHTQPLKHESHCPMFQMTPLVSSWHRPPIVWVPEVDTSGQWIMMVKKSLMLKGEGDLALGWGLTCFFNPPEGLLFFLSLCLCRLLH